MTQNASVLDLRVRRTRMLLRNALIELTVEQGFAAVTVQQITERAMVNRATFYRHYTDKYDLVMSNVRELVDELGPYEEPYGPPALRHLLEHIVEHAKFYRIILGKDGMAPFSAHIRSYVEQHLRMRLEAMTYDPARMRVPLDLCISFMANAMLGTITWWLEHDLPYTAEQMALWLPQLNVHGLSYGLGTDIHHI
ncbi:MAG: TetR/AcrR family transcriptional regulator [Herpetosiphonaceae bacterium]|nr:TetR/AcrR family transcriptional regulator [Herpetosiphonaceae bacterium]